ncbi:MAG TPA: hypothetical protein VLB44_15735 [Kofleriaceae bacterium]|nr:hypothetical protein [Kofleriaceae bacterium]
MVRTSLLVVVMAACGGSSGKLTNPHKPLADFVTDKDPMLVDTGGGGLVRIRLDGSERQPIAPAKYHLIAKTSDGGVLAFEDSDTNLYILDRSSTTPRRVPELDHRTGEAALRPDGAVLAATKHADFSQPQSQWHDTEDDTVYLVDTKTLAVDVIPKARFELVTRLMWAPDGRSIYQGMFGFDTLQLDLATRTRTKVEWPANFAVQARDRCGGAHIEMRGWKGDQGFDVVDAKGSSRHVVTIEGRSRGFHDYLATIDSAAFTRSCKYIVFTYEHSVWVADVATGTVGHLISGGSPVLLDGP